MRVQKKLTIAIPTYNRWPYLQDLIGLLFLQCEESPGICEDIEILILDNASSDNSQGLPEYIERNSPLESLPIRYIRNECNVGADENFLKCIQEANGEYVWLVGDDELLEENAVTTILEVLYIMNPRMLILMDKNYCSGVTKNKVFSNYGQLVSFFCNINPHFVLAHTLISLNVFRKSVFSLEFARSKIKTNYLHMYGLMPDLISKGPVVLLIEKPLVIVRDNRAPFHVKPSMLGIKQGLYMLFLGRRSNNFSFTLYALKFLIRQIRF